MWDVKNTHQTTIRSASDDNTHPVFWKSRIWFGEVLETYARTWRVAKLLQQIDPDRNVSDMILLLGARRVLKKILVLKVEQDDGNIPQELTQKLISSR